MILLNEPMGSIPVPDLLPHAIEVAGDRGNPRLDTFHEAAAAETIARRGATGWLGAAEGGPWKSPILRKAILP
jgi:hypothetical protein